MRCHARDRVVLVGFAAILATVAACSSGGGVQESQKDTDVPQEEDWDVTLQEDTDVAQEEDFEAGVPDVASPPAQTFRLRDARGYSYEIEAYGVELGSDEVASAPPGHKHVVVASATVWVTNTTPGRNAPLPRVGYDLALPDPGCSEGQTCRAGFRVFYVDVYPRPGDREIPAEGSLGYELAVDLQYQVEESLPTGGYYWRPWAEADTPFGAVLEEPAMAEGSWIAVGELGREAPSF